jgi:hypothetical protein
MGCLLASESASVAGGMLREHKVIHNCEESPLGCEHRHRDAARAQGNTPTRQARENASVSRRMPQEHKAVRNCKLKGESEGSNRAPPKVQQGQAQHKVA